MMQLMVSVFRIGNTWDLMIVAHACFWINLLRLNVPEENSTTDLKLLSDKVATINVMIKDDKLKNEENFLKSERHQNEITRSCDILREKLENLKGTQDDTQKERLVAEKAIKKL